MANTIGGMAEFSPFTFSPHHPISPITGNCRTSTGTLFVFNHPSNTLAYTDRKSIACCRLPIASLLRLGWSPTIPDLTLPPTKSIGAAEP